MKWFPGVLIGQSYGIKVWHPVVYIGGKPQYILSQSTLSGFVECETMQAATRYAEEHAKGLNERQKGAGR